MEWKFTSDETGKHEPEEANLKELELWFQETTITKLGGAKISILNLLHHSADPIRMSLDVAV